MLSRSSGKVDDVHRPVSELAGNCSSGPPTPDRLSTGFTNGVKRTGLEHHLTVMVGREDRPLARSVSSAKVRSSIASSNTTLSNYFERNVLDNCRVSLSQGYSDLNVPPPWPPLGSQVACLKKQAREVSLSGGNNQEPRGSWFGTYAAYK